MIPPGRPMDRETLAQAIAVVDAERLHDASDRDGDLAYNRAVEDCVSALEQLRDAAPRGEEPPIELTDDMIHQMLGEAEAAYNRARSDAGGSGEGHRVQHEFGKFAKAETVRSYLFQAGILPAPVGGQTPSSHSCQDGKDYPFSAKGCGVCGNGSEEPDERKVGGQTPTEPPRRIECDYLCSLCGDMHPLAMDCPIASLRATAPPPPGAPPAFTPLCQCGHEKDSHKSPPPTGCSRCYCANYREVSPPAFTREDELASRSKRFSDTTGALTGGNCHPDRCVCQEKEIGQFADTPHKHYIEPPFKCARCACRGYQPKLPAEGRREIPAHFTRDDIERMVNIVSNMLGEMEHHDNGSLILMLDMLSAYAKTVPTEGRQETR